MGGDLMHRYEHLDMALCKELERLDKKYAGDTAEMSQQDVERADTLYHALKCGETYYAMIGVDDESDESIDRREYYPHYKDSRSGRYRDSHWDRR